MITILNCWRQFGRRYLWPHLLLGMVAVSFGLPGIYEQRVPDSAAIVHSNGVVLHLNSFALLQDYPRHLTDNINYWHQNVIRRIIRHLSFSLPSFNCLIKAPVLRVVKLQLLGRLNILLSEQTPPVPVSRSANFSHSPRRWPHDTASWLATIVGIRAGPLFIV